MFITSQRPSPDRRSAGSTLSRVSATSSQKVAHRKKKSFRTTPNGVHVSIALSIYSLFPSVIRPGCVVDYESEEVRFESRPGIMC